MYLKHLLSQICKAQKAKVSTLCQQNHRGPEAVPRVTLTAVIHWPVFPGRVTYSQGRHTGCPVTKHWADGRHPGPSLGPQEHTQLSGGLEIHHLEHDTPSTSTGSINHVRIRIFMRLIVSLQRGRSTHHRAAGCAGVQCCFQGAVLLSGCSRLSRWAFYSGW